MIALIISGTNDEYANVRLALEEKGYNVIQYSNFMKAYDNLEEISPDLIVLNSQDYPRHWKIISFAAKNFKSKKICTILLTNHSFSENNEASSVSAYPFVFESQENFDKSLFFELLNTISNAAVPFEENEKVISSKIDYDDYFDEEDFAAPSFEELLSHSADEYISTGSKCNFVYMNPSVMSIITGKVISFVYPEICFLPDRKEGFQSVYGGQILDDCTLKTEIGLSSVKTCVTDVSDTITMHIC